MKKGIMEIVSEIRKNRDFHNYDEATARQTVILRFLNTLNWNIFDSNEVTPEYTVGSRRVDYSLRINNKDMIFIEAKRPSELLDKHEEQLLDYAFRQGVEFAVLTNGTTWWFYLPMKPGSWENRKFYSIDILEQDIESIANKFIELLEREAVKSGNSKKIKSGHKSLKKNKCITKVAS